MEYHVMHYGPITEEEMICRAEEQGMTNDDKLKTLIANDENEPVPIAYRNPQLQSNWEWFRDSLTETMTKRIKTVAVTKIKTIAQNIFSDGFCILVMSPKSDDSGMIEILRQVFGKMIESIIRKTGTYNGEIAQRKFSEMIANGYSYFPLHNKKYGYHILEFCLCNESPRNVFTENDVAYTMSFPNTETIFSSIIKSYKFRIYGPHSKEMIRILKRRIDKSIKLKPVISEIFASYPVTVLSGNYDNNLLSLSISQYQLDKIEFPQKKTIIEKLDLFTSNRKLYVDNHLKYRFSILLYGKPGTGKTSFIYSYAIKHKMRIIKIDSELIAINEKISRSNNSSGNMISSRIAECIDITSGNPTLIMFDELDLMLESSESLRKLLTVIDQIPENTIIAATTNHIEKLPEALIRSGRFDNRYELSNIDSEYAKTICNDYGIRNTDDVLSLFPDELSTYNPADLVARITEQLFHENGIEYSHKENIEE